MNFHYAKAVPSVQYGYNVYTVDGEWAGVVLFGGGATPHIASPFGLVQGEVLELVRVALNGKQPCTSECVAAALKRLHHDAPQVKIVVSYADCDQRHAGIIYQATNWIYLGNDNAGQRGAFIIHGKKMHPKSVHAKGWKQSISWLKEHVDPDVVEFRTEGKHKYIFVFDKRMRKQYVQKALPYPKNN
jgi:hypothetical protein